MLRRIGLLLAVVCREGALFGSVGIFLYLMSRIDMNLTLAMTVIYLSHFVSNKIAQNIASNILSEKYEEFLNQLEKTNNENIEGNQANIIGFTKGAKADQDSEKGSE